MINVIDGIFTPQACESLCKSALKLPVHEVTKDFRKCELRWIKKGENKHTALVMKTLITIANKVRELHGIKRELTSESAQFTTYHENGQYKMHTDNSGKPNLLTRHRQLSMVIQINDPNEFIGGGIEFKDSDFVSDYVLKQGTIVTFNSHMQHRAKPVKIGVRHVLVAWFFPVDCAYYEERDKGIIEDAHEQNKRSLEEAAQKLRGKV